MSTKVTQLSAPAPVQRPRSLFALIVPESRPAHLPSLATCGVVAGGTVLQMMLLPDNTEGVNAWAEWIGLPPPKRLTRKLPRSGRMVTTYYSWGHVADGRYAFVGCTVPARRTATSGAGVAR